MITLDQTNRHHITRMLTITSDFYLVIFINGTFKCDHIKWQISLSSDYLKRFSLKKKLFDLNFFIFWKDYLNLIVKIDLLIHFLLYSAFIQNSNRSPKNLFWKLVNGILSEKIRFVDTKFCLLCVAEAPKTPLKTNEFQICILLL